MREGKKNKQRKRKNLKDELVRVLGHFHQGVHIFRVAEELLLDPLLHAQRALHLLKRLLLKVVEVVRRRQPGPVPAQSGRHFRTLWERKRPIV